VRLSILHRCLWAIASTAIFAGAAPAQNIPAPPTAPRDQVVDVLHGVRVPDPYRWLENASSPRTRAWIEAEQRYTHRLLDHQPSLDRLQGDLRTLTALETPEAVIYRRGRYVILKKERNRQIASLYLRDGIAGPERRLIDAQSLSPDNSTTIELLNVSEDGNVIAYGLRRGGQDQLSIHFYDVAEGRTLPDFLPESRYIYWSLLMSANGTRIYYITFGSEGPRLYAHQLGTSVKSDTMLFGSGLGPQIILQANLSADGGLLLLEALHGATGPTDLYLLPTEPGARARTVVKGVAANFVARAAQGHIFISTDWQAPRGRIMEADSDRPGIENWRVLIPEQADPLESFALAGNNLMLLYMHNAHSRLEVARVDGKIRATVPLAGMGTVTAIDGTWNLPVVCFSYAAFQTPATFYAYSIPAQTETVISGPNAPDWLSDIVTDQVWYRSSDGTKVPMFLAHKRALGHDADHPVLLYGYGGFDWAQTPDFSPEEAVWIEHGGIYALANIRGGNEFGEAWHRAGDLDHKQNSFDDFAAAARWLVAHHYTSPRRLGIQGMSNGGLLVLASITQHPALFGAAIARYPLADMLRYERFGIAGWWLPEYGSVKNPEQFRTLYAYSPYQHVATGRDYPAVLLVTGANDTRVNPAHSLKMTAALQNASASGRPVLLLYDSKSGHSGTLPAGLEVAQTAHELAFLFWQLGMPRK
jgi:prolyl oligopeptidase